MVPPSMGARAGHPASEMTSSMPGPIPFTTSMPKVSGCNSTRSNRSTILWGHGRIPKSKINNALISSDVKQRNSPQRNLGARDRAETLIQQLVVGSQISEAMLNKQLV